MNLKNLQKTENRTLRERKRKRKKEVKTKNRGNFPITITQFHS